MFCRKKSKIPVLFKVIQCLYSTSQNIFDFQGLQESLSYSSTFQDCVTLTYRSGKKISITSFDNSVDRALII